MEISKLREFLREGQVLPALPLALTEDRAWSQGHQRALIRYYHAAGAGGVAVAVHSTQFEIREPQHALFEPVLKLAAGEMEALRQAGSRSFLGIAGICGRTEQALQEANLARDLGYSAGLLSLAAMGADSVKALLEHCRAVATEIPLIGFYLQAAVGGRVLPLEFWRGFVEIPQVVAVKIAPFNRYQTLEVVRAVVESGREDIALYTGNDDTIVADLLTPYTFNHQGRAVTRYIDGGLLGHWGVWTHAAVQLLAEIKAARQQDAPLGPWLARATAVTDMNAALFDAAHGFAGCIPGILEILRRQRLVPSAACLNPHEQLSPGQAAELDRVTEAYPELTDRAFVEANLSHWLNGK